MTRGRSVALTPGRLQLTFTNYTWASAPLQFSTMPLVMVFIIVLDTDGDRPTIFDPHTVAFGCST